MYYKPMIIQPKSTYVASRHNRNSNKPSMFQLSMFVFTQLESDQSMVLTHTLVVLKSTLTVQEDWTMVNGEVFVISIGIFKMPEYCVASLDMQMLQLLQCLHILARELDQYGLIMYNVLDLSQTYLNVGTMALLNMIVNMVKMLQLNAQVHMHTQLYVSFCTKLSYLVEQLFNF